MYLINYGDNEQCSKSKLRKRDTKEEQSKHNLCKNYDQVPRMYTSQLFEEKRENNEYAHSSISSYLSRMIVCTICVYLKPAMRQLLSVSGSSIYTMGK